MKRDGLRAISRVTPEPRGLSCDTTGAMCFGHQAVSKREELSLFLPSGDTGGATTSTLGPSSRNATRTKV